MPGIALSHHVLFISYLCELELHTDSGPIVVMTLALKEALAMATQMLRGAQARSSSERQRVLHFITMTANASQEEVFQPCCLSRPASQSTVILFVKLDALGTVSPRDGFYLPFESTLHAHTHPCGMLACRVTLKGRERARAQLLGRRRRARRRGQQARLAF